MGLGGIGYGVAKRAAGFGLRIIAVDARREECPPEVEALWKPDRLADLLGQADIVAVCVPETPATRGLFDAERFAQLQAGAYFINIGRGKVVQLDALVAALCSGHLAGAALDVYEQEPLPADHPLWGFDNVLMTPHVAGVDDNDEDRRIAVLADNLRRFVAGDAATQRRGQSGRFLAGRAPANTPCGLSGTATAVIRDGCCPTTPHSRLPGSGRGCKSDDQQ